MRKKRNETAKKANWVRVVLLLFIVIPLVGVIIGYGVSKVFLIPYLAEPQNEETLSSQQDDQGTDNADQGTDSEPIQQNDKEADEHQRPFTVEGLKLFRIQVGAFSGQQNALVLAEELNDKGMAASIDTHDISRVYTLYTFSEDMATARLEQVRKSYSDAHISSVEYPSVEINLSESFSRQADLLTDQLKECKDMMLDITAQDVAGSNINDAVRQQKDLIEQFVSQISQTDWPMQVKELKEAVLMLYTAILESYSSYDNLTSVPGQTSMELINCYIMFLNKLSSMV